MWFSAQRMSSDKRYTAQNCIILPPTKFWSQFEWQHTKSCSFCPKLSWNVRIQKRLCLLCGHPCPLEGLQRIAFTDSDHRMNGCQEMLSPTFQPFWSFKACLNMSEHAAELLKPGRGCADVFDGLWYPCNQSRMGASCSARALHWNLYSYIKQGDTDSRSPGEMNVQHIFWCFFSMLCPFQTSALW